jgi:hypothetical protein
LCAGRPNERHIQGNGRRFSLRGVTLVRIERIERRDIGCGLRFRVVERR